LLTNVALESRYRNFKIAIEAEIVRKILYEVPYCELKTALSNFPKLKYAESDDVPYPDCDILVGSEYVEFVLEEQKYFFEGPVIHDTKFGFVLSGATKSSSLATKSFCGVSTVDINDQLKRYLGLEDVREDSSSNNAEIIAEHKLIEDHFARTHQRITPQMAESDFSNSIFSPSKRPNSH